jgi:hypothetical protein
MGSFCDRPSAARFLKRSWQKPAAASGTARASPPLPKLCFNGTNAKVYSAFCDFYSTCGCQGPRDLTREALLPSSRGLSA